LILRYFLGCNTFKFRDRLTYQSKIQFPSSGMKSNAGAGGKLSWLPLLRLLFNPDDAVLL
jgi:hypothetical protein